MIRLSLLSLALIISLVALEYVLSKFAPRQKAWLSHNIYKPDKYIGWRGNPEVERNYTKGRVVEYVRRNSHGFKDKERTYEKGRDVFRIVVLGDSYTEALQVPIEKTFPYILEKRLNSESGKRYEVLNLGISGFGTAQEYLTFKYYGSKYHPDLVILQFFIGNDVVNNSLALEPQKENRPFFVLNAGKLEELPFNINDKSPSKTKTEVATKYQVKNLLSKYTIKFFPNIYYIVEDRIESTPWLGNFLWKIGIKKFKPEMPNRYENYFPPYHHIYMYSEAYLPELEEGWRITKALILKLARELETDKIGFLVVVIPGEYEFRHDLWNDMLNEYPQMKGIKFDLMKPERILSIFFDANKIDYLILRPEFERYSKETHKDLHFHYKYEPHWKPEGHALTAELIYKKLNDDKLVK